MRKVLRNHDEVAHVWAQQLQHEGRASNVFFYGKTIYSYGEHFPMARFEKKNVVLMNSNSYSVSTSKHQSIVLRALDLDTVKVFHVPDTGAEREMRCDYRNVKSYFDDFEKHLDKASRARGNYSYYLSTAKASRENAFEYCKEFRCKKHLKKFDFDFDFDSDSVKEKVSKIKIRDKENEERRIARQQKALKEGVLKWRNGENVLIHHYHKTLLRLSSNGKTVETSKRAYFPLEDAKRAIRFVKAIVKKGEPWTRSKGSQYGLWEQYYENGRLRNGERFKIGIYHLDTVSACGDVKAGCHNVKFEEIERLNNAL